MKLKKIASLMLAGVMAVSMLAGCSTNGNNNDKNEPEVPAAGISASVGSLLKAPKYVTFADSSKLDAALKTAVEYAGVMDIMPQYVHEDELVDVDSSISDRLGITTTADLAIDNIGSQEKLAAAEKAAGAGYEIPDATVTAVWAISGSIGENAVKQQIAEKLAYVEKYNYAVVNNNDTIGGNFNFSYTVSVSTCTKAVNSAMNGGANVDIGLGGMDFDAGIVGAENPSVTFVAVQIVRTAVHQ